MRDLGMGVKVIGGNPKMEGKVAQSSTLRGDGAKDGGKR